ncbi:MAG TPA: glycosyltransferase, partial [Cellulomonas sp.]
MTDTLPPGGRAPETRTSPTVASVTAVVVSRGRTPFLATTLRALAAQTRLPARVVLVDVGPGPDPAVPDLLRAAGLGPTPTEGPAVLRGRPVVRVRHDPRARTFGDAVRTAVADLPTADGGGGWLWLLHDDSAPGPAALAELVRAVEAAPSVGVAGAKQHTWTRPARLLEVGLRTSRSGRRMTDVEPGEVDQGQHDGRDDVLGVGIAGALVRRDVWELLRGTDPALGPFGDGFDLSRRARLAGHRVVVVPAAVVRHAQAAYHGLRGEDAGPESFVDLDADGEPDAADPRRSYAARRTALLHQRLVGAPLPLLPLVALMACLAAVVRVLVRVATKEPVLAAAEVAAPLRALGRPAAVLRARAQARRTHRLARRTLRPLQADLRTVWQQWRDRRLTRAEARRVVRAPSELELRELAVLATRRRIGLGVLVVALLAVTAVAFGRVIVPVLGGSTLVGGALVPATDGLGDLWHAATSGWVAGDLGHGGPADALLTALLPGAAVSGGRVSLVLAVLLLGSVLLAGLGAWFAAGAATRSVTVRVWAAVVWAALPPLVLAAGQGRVGAVLVHLALPWCVLGLARAVGAQQTDVVLSGVATAVRTPAGAPERGVDDWGDPEAWARAGGAPTDDEPDDETRDAAEAPVLRRGRRSAWADPGADDPGTDDEAAAEGTDDDDATAGVRPAGTGRSVDEHPVGSDLDAAATPVRGVPAVGAAAGRDARDPVTAAVLASDRTAAPEVTSGPGGHTGPVRHDAGAGPAERAVGDDAAPVGTALDGTAPDDLAPDDLAPDAADPWDADVPAPLPAPTRPTGSIAAAAGASLAFAVLVAGAPALLAPGLLVLVAVAACAPRRRRLRVLVAAVPALAILGPTLVEAASRGTDGLRLLLADPGAPLASSPAEPLAQLLGVPVDGSSLVPDWLPTWVPGVVTDWWPAATGAAVLLLAVLALLRGAPQARAVRLGWFAAAVGLLVAAVSGRVVVGDDTGATVVGWAGAGVSFATAGLLTAAVVGTRGVRVALDRFTFGWRQLGVALVAAVVVVVPVVEWGGWAWQARRSDASALTTLDQAVVPAIGRQTQESADAPRILALTPGPDDVTTWQLLRGDGPQLVEESAAARTRVLTGGLADAATADPDAADAELEGVVAALAAGATTDQAPGLAALAVADVLVPPPADDADPTTVAARTTLVGRLDATPGLERITEGDSGVIWRVQPVDETAATDAATSDDAASDDATDDDAASDAADDAAAASSTVTAWARLVPDATAAADPDGLTGADATAVAATGTALDTTIPAGTTDRLLVLAERADAGWHATLDGQPLRAVTDGWRQTFAVGPDGG